MVGWYSYSPLSSRSAGPGGRGGPTGPSAGLRDVLRLGGALPDRLVAQVIAAWSARLDAGDEAVGPARPRLHAALYGRFAAVVRTWLGDPDVRIDLTMGAPGSSATVERNDDGLRVGLPFAWLADVWLPGFALVADRLCLSAREAQPRRFELTTLDRGLTRPVPVTVEVHQQR